MRPPGTASSVRILLSAFFTAPGQFQRGYSTRPATACLTLAMSRLVRGTVWAAGGDRLALQQQGFEFVGFRTCSPPLVSIARERVEVAGEATTPPPRGCLVLFRVALHAVHPHRQQMGPRRECHLCNTDYTPPASARPLLVRCKRQKLRMARPNPATPSMRVCMSWVTAYPIHGSVTPPLDMSTPLLIPSGR